MGLLGQNEDALGKFRKEFLFSYKNAKKEERSNCRIEELPNGQKVICRLLNNRIWRLNSIYDPERAAHLYAERYAKIKDYSLICIFGLSDGKAIRHLLANCNNTHTVFIYEPDREIFFTAMETFPLDDIFCRNNLELVVGGINDGKLKDKLMEVVTYQNRTLVEHCVLPNYNVMYPVEEQTYIDTRLYSANAEVFNKHTEMAFAPKFADNLLKNLPYLLSKSSVTRLSEVFAAMSVQEIPAIIVSAGPSLDKNIKELKKAEGRAFILSVDSAVKALIREGITFDLAISIDPRKNPDVFSDDRANRYPYVLSNYSLPLIAQKNRNCLFFEGGYGFNTFEAMVQAKTGLEMKTVETGGSVATDAMSLVLELGFRKIILVGQDLAFTDGKGHVSGFEKSKEADLAHVREAIKETVEAYGGNGTVLTDIQMNSYRQWFEQCIQQVRSYAVVYNATEGGARMQGAIEMPLKEAIGSLCVKEMNFKEMIAKVPPSFTKKQQRELGELFYDSPRQVDILQQKLYEGVLIYDKLIQMEKSGAYNAEEYKQTLQNIYEVNHIEEENDYMSLIRLYAKESEYEAAEDIYVAEDLSVQEIAERGKKMLEGYVAGCEICRKRLEELLLPGIDELLKKLEVSE